MSAQIEPGNGAVEFKMHLEAGTTPFDSSGTENSPIKRKHARETRLRGQHRRNRKCANLRITLRTPPQAMEYSGNNSNRQQVPSLPLPVCGSRLESKPREKHLYHGSSFRPGDQTRECGSARPSGVITARRRARAVRRRRGSPLARNKLIWGGGIRAWRSRAIRGIPDSSSSPCSRLARISRARAIYGVRQAGEPRDFNP